MILRSFPECVFSPFSSLRPCGAHKLASIVTEQVARVSEPTEKLVLEGPDESWCVRVSKRKRLDPPTEHVVNNEYLAISSLCEWVWAHMVNGQ